jgi:hypothetical protein
MDATFLHLALIVLGLLAVQLGTLPDPRRAARRSGSSTRSRREESRSGARPVGSH